MLSFKLPKLPEGSESELELFSLSEPLLCCTKDSNCSAAVAPVYPATKRSSWPKCCRHKNEARRSEEFSVSELPLLHGREYSHVFSITRTEVFLLCGQLGCCADRKSVV